MKNNEKVQSQLFGILTSNGNRMKDLMKFGINEGKNVAYTGVEFEKVAADGKLYGIVREGAKYYIKTSPSKKGKLAENYEYIGGFRNRQANEYGSFAEAQKQFDLKMMSINEANSPEKKIVVDSWNPDKQEELTVESTDKMKREIARERQIMMNASRINEKKEQNLNPINSKECKDGECDKNCGYNFEDAKKPKNSFRSEKHQEGDAKKANKGYKNVSVKESAEPLAWHKEGSDAKGNITDTYMDKSHGTEIGSSAPFDTTDDKEAKNGVVAEGESMHDSDNQNTPSVGTAGRTKAKKVDDPFNKEKGKDITEDIDDLDNSTDVDDDASVSPDASLGDDADDTSMDDYEGADDTDDVDDDLDDTDDDDVDDDLNDTDDDDVDDTDPDIADIQDQISALNQKLDAVLSAIGADEPSVDTSKYDDDDDDLYGDEDSDDDDLDDTDDNLEDCTVYESRAFKKAIMEDRMRNRRMRRINEDGMKPFTDNGRVPSGNMNKLNDFGKHPAYQKKVMSLPPKDMQEFPDYYDMNDESTHSDAPYGQKIGSGKPFEVDPEEMTNAIAESIKRNLKKYIR